MEKYFKIETILWRAFPTIFTSLIKISDCTGEWNTGIHKRLLISPWWKPYLNRDWLLFCTKMVHKGKTSKKQNSCNSLFLKLHWNQYYGISIISWTFQCNCYLFNLLKQLKVLLWEVDGLWGRGEMILFYIFIPL